MTTIVCSIIHVTISCNMAQMNHGDHGDDVGMNNIVSELSFERSHANT